ncbi:MAG TPA: hypothetical protein VG714_07460 [Acidobacteriaceae bacterium]|nr:hypothetical protein [Acidobacteriaceae bacterium]
MGGKQTIGVVLAVLGVGVMVYSRLIRAGHATIPPSREEVAAKNKRMRMFGVGAALSLFGLLLLLVP